MKKAAIYARVSTPDQHIETQLYQLRELALRRGFEVVQEYTDVGVSGSKARRGGLDALLADAHRRKDRWPSFCYDDEEDKIDTKRFVELAKAYIARKEAAAQPETLDSSPTKPDTSGHRT